MLNTYISPDGPETPDEDVKYAVMDILESILMTLHKSGLVTKSNLLYDYNLEILESFDPNFPHYD